MHMYMYMLLSCMLVRCIEARLKLDVAQWRLVQIVRGAVHAYPPCPIVSVVPMILRAVCVCVWRGGARGAGGALFFGDGPKTKVKLSENGHVRIDNRALTPNKVNSLFYRVSVA